MRSNRKHEMPVKRLIIVAVFLSILGLVIIHIAYKLCGPEWLVSEWSAGDALSYYGALIASVITIYGLYLTFMDNRKGISEQSRLDKLPFIGIIMLNQNHRIPLFEFEDPTAIQLESRAFKGTHEGYYYTETRPDTFFCVIENGKTVVKRALPKEKLSLIRFHGIEIVHVASGISLTTHHNLLYIPLEVTNVGNGAAIDLHFGFNKLDNGIKITERYTPPIPLKIDSDLYIAIYADNDQNENCGQYLMEYYYKDIFGNHYVQKQVFELGVDTEKNYYGTLENGMQQEMIDHSMLPHVLQEGN